jgi:predicted Fe-Mo cluster-binding NifX family protein
MNIAIPTFRSRVSPRFDLAASLLIVQVQGNRILGRGEERLDNIYGWRRVRFLTSRNVNVVLCGGIRRCDYFAIVDSGIDVYAGLMGEIDDVLEGFLRGDIVTNGNGHALPGRGWQQARWRGGRRGPGRGRGRGPRNELTNRQ